MKKQIALATMAAVLGLSATAYGAGDSQKADTAAKVPADVTLTKSAEVENKDKPLVWFNRQPSNSSTGELDMTALNYNKDTYYVGFDANQGAELQGTMVDCIDFSPYNKKYQPKIKCKYCLYLC